METAIIVPTLQEAENIEALITQIEQTGLPRQLHDLVKRLFHLPRGLRMNAVAPALLDAEMAVLRELIRPDQGEEIRFLACLEQLARFGDVFVVTPDSHQQIAPAHQRRAQRRRRHATLPGRFDQHPRISRVHRQPKHLPPDGSQVGIFDFRFSIYKVTAFLGVA